ncbi:FRG domain-containing protein [Leuconostoc mesenteroides]|uniref:FRG domain-containing protein n=1 Tax=Leuconostoc mesenteroides TaxID=1245 RepID=UPI001FB97058|nr:FRG domain-containing protein [Leuconostoc mesenteroides]MCJ2158601.1 FRG domain-containing protein [Leuconostoc mesenteroides]MCM6835974.1 FRG domain-containing protein [Leuconostoc mesenteroides]
MTEETERYQAVQGINTLSELALNQELISDFFRTVTIKIKISPLNEGDSISRTFDNDHAQQYTITGISVVEDEKSKNSPVYNDVVQIVEMLSERICAIDINQKITELIEINTKYAKLKEDLEELLKNNKTSIFNSEWSVFYLLKELFQCIKEKIKRTAYYRGQSENWEAIPGVIRPGVDKSYALEFEEIYHNLAFEFENIEYIRLEQNMSLECQEKRAQNIALLQHFNLLTPYVDITSNEFIAMFFMIDSAKIKNPCIDILFQSEDKDDNKQSLVQKAPTSHQNVRLSAQKGSFLNFEKVLVNDSITRIDRIRVTIDYDVRSHFLIMEQEKDDLGNNAKETQGLESIILETNGDEVEIERQLAEKVSRSGKKLQELLREAETDQDNKIINNDKIHAAFVENFEYGQKLTELKKNRDKLFSNLKDEIERKLEEFRYTSAEIYPDLPNRLSSIKTKYSNQSSRNLKQTVKIDKIQ